MMLHHLLSRMAAQRPDAPAVRDTTGEHSYAKLDARANQLGHALLDLKVKPGERVGILLPKGLDSLAAMQAILRIGAIYVPLDPLSPASRTGAVITNCSMSAVVTDRASAEVGVRTLDPAAMDLLPGIQSVKAIPDPGGKADDPAYILYTSGSTGAPKGVCLSHRNALAFVEWAAAEVELTSKDRVSGHSAFHFDLSVFDIYATYLAGAQLIIVPETIAFLPAALVDLLCDHDVSVWYSVPSVLVLMAEQGGLLDRTPRALRTMIFAGEEFPTKALARLRQALPLVRMLNWYGPTETNVCTAFDVAGWEIGSGRVPIGTAVCGDKISVVRDDGTQVGVGERGMLICEGPTVSLGYWGGVLEPGRRHHTGDIVEVLPSGDLSYVGRQDRMVKVRGHRIELGDVEVALQAHPAVREVAVAAIGSGTLGKLVAFVRAEGSKPTLLAVKRYCAERLPRYMIVDEVRYVSEFPRTANGKIDYVLLRDIDDT